MNKSQAETAENLKWMNKSMCNVKVNKQKSRFWKYQIWIEVNEKHNMKELIIN